MATTKMKGPKRKARPGPETGEPAGGTEAGRRIIGALREFSETLAAGVPIEERFTVRGYRLNLTPSEYGPENVKRVRDTLGMSQGLFATFLGVSHATVKSWEQGANTPSPIARRFMDEVALDPERWMASLAERGCLKLKDAAAGASRPQVAASAPLATPDMGSTRQRKPRK